MSKNITAAQKTNIEQTVTTQACCVEIIRPDGTIYRMTDHNEDITYDGAIYDASLPFNVGPIDTGSGGSVDNTQLSLFCDETFFKLEDFRRRLFDNSRIKIFYVDYTTPSEGALVLRQGWFGSMSFAQNKNVEVTVIGLMKLLDFKVVRTFSPLCNADLGDDRCGVAIDFSQAYGPANTYALGDQVYGYNQASMTALTLSNPSFEADAGTVNVNSPIDSWTKLGSAKVEVAANESGLSPTDGSYLLSGAPDGGADDNGYISALYNEIDVSSLSTDVDAGKITFALFFDYGVYTNVLSAGRVTVDFINASGLIIDSKSTDWMFLETAGEWHNKAVIAPMISGVRTVRVTISMYKGDDTEPRVAFDNFDPFYWDHTAGNPYGGVIQRLRNIISADARSDYRPSNGGFESDGVVALANNPTITDWTVTGYAQVTSGVHGLAEQHGTYFLSHGSDGSGMQHTTTLVRTLDLETDCNLTAATIDAGNYICFVRAFLGFGDAGDSVIDIDLKWQTGAPADISTTAYANAYSKGSTGWNTFLEGAAIPATARQVEITITLTSPAASDAGTASVDDFRLNFVERSQINQETPLTGSGAEPLTGSTWAGTAGQLTFDAETDVLVWEAIDAHVDFDVVASVTDNKEFVATSMAGSNELYRGGYIRWLSGNNAGRKHVVRVWTSGTKTVKFYIETPYDIQAGDRFMYVKSCQKRFQQDCINKFGNGLNFRGFPYSPGRLVNESGFTEVTEQST